MTALAISNPQVRVRLERTADYLAGGMAAALPWSTSITGILVVCWLICLLPTLDLAELRRKEWTFAEVMPVALAALAVVGVLWAIDVPWKDRLAGIAPYAKLVLIPILMWQFSRRDGGERVLWMFLFSACVLLAVSWLMVLSGWTISSRGAGVPARDYISQSGIFTLCFFALVQRFCAAWTQSRARALFCLALACGFLTNIVFIALARTSLVVIVVLFAVFGIVYLTRRGLAILIAIVIALMAVTWTTSKYLRSRVTNVMTELKTFSPEHDTSAGARMVFWKSSLEAVGSAPVIGHGTGSIRATFARQAGLDINAPGVATNPHNQILAVAIPWGIIGVIVLLAMWASHVKLFLTRDFAGWIGLSVVVQNIVGSQFNSHIADFSQGWLYVFGAGVAGGMVLRNRNMVRSRAPAATPS